MQNRLSRSYYKTFRDAPSDAETISNQLMMRAGMLRKHAPGIFSYTPLMNRVLLKVTQLLRDVFDDIQWEECLMPMVIPSELWKETGRWNLFGDQLLKLKDRKGQEYCLGPTHEEVVTDLARYLLSSYKQLPFTLYQIQTKFRDEIRPRFGVMRAREFIMMDGYSFHGDMADLDRHYEEVRAAYCRFFDALGLRYRVVEADTGAIGGSDSHEFHVLADSGEDLLLWCDQCQYAANVERAQRSAKAQLQAKVLEDKQLRKVPTPGAKGIDDVCKILGVHPHQTLKSVVFQNPQTGDFVGVSLRGDLEVSLTKIMAKWGWTDLVPADPQLIFNKFGVHAGGYSPLSLPKLFWLIDQSILADRAYILGSGHGDEHYTGAVAGRDFPHPGTEDKRWGDFAVAKEGDPCPRCHKGHYQSNRGIEVGHIFKLGDKYSKSMNLSYLDPAGKSLTPVMGCYGIGVTRVIAAAIEQNHDKDGIKFPVAMSPIDLQIINLTQNEPKAEEWIQKWLGVARRSRKHAAVDDRDLQPGVKFKDADLTGSPYHLILGKKFVEGQVEFKNRLTGERTTLPLDGVEAHLTTLW